MPFHHTYYKTVRMARLVCFAAFLIMTLPSLAGKRYWILNTGTGNWNATANWSTTATGAGGSSVPAVNDTAYFTGSRNGSCTINAAVSVRRFEVQSGYTGTISQGANNIAVQNGNAQFSGGTFTGGSNNITINGTLTISGCAFTSTTATLNANDDFTFSSGSFTHNSGTVDIRGSNNTVTGSMTFNNLRFSPSLGASTYTIASGTTLTVNGTLTMLGAAPNSMQLNTGTIHAKGNVTVSATATGSAGNAVIVINGTGTQTLTGSGSATGGSLPNISISKTSGTLNLSSTISVSGYWSWGNGTVSAGTSTVAFVTPSANNSSNNTIDLASPWGDMSFNHVTIQTGTRTLGSTLFASGNLNITSGATLSAGVQSIEVGGDWNNSGTWTMGTSTVMFNGTGYQRVIKSSGTEAFYKFRVNKSSGSLTLNCPATVSNQLILTSGKLKTTLTNYISLLAGSTVSGGSDAAYVHGFVRKTGNTAFTFPMGDTTLSSGAYHPLTMTAPSSATDEFETNYIAAAQTQGASFAGDSLEEISSCEYWVLRRVTGSSTVKPTLGWNSNNCVLEGGPAGLRVTRWSGTSWLNDGNGGYTVAGGTGSVTSTVFVGSGSGTYLTLARKKEDQFFILNTLGVDSLEGSDTLKYKITGPQLSGIYKVGQLKTFLPYTPVIGSTSNVQLRFFHVGATDTAIVKFDIDHYAEISNVLIDVGSGPAALDTNLYDVLTDTVLVLFNNGHVYSEQLPAPVTLDIDGGVRITPNGDGIFDNFRVLGGGAYTTYQLTITSFDGATIYQTSNPSSEWNGRNGSNELVDRGAYFFQLTLDGNTLGGQFTVEY